MSLNYYCSEEREGYDDGGDDVLLVLALVVLVVIPALVPQTCWNLRPER